MPKQKRRRKRSKKPLKPTGPDPVDVLPIGGSVRLISVTSLATELHASLDDTLDFLWDLDVPVARIINDPNLYFDLWSLECVLRVRLMPYGPGFPTPGDWPGSEALRRPSHAIKSILAIMEKIGRYYTAKTRDTLKHRCRNLAREIRKQVEIPKESAASKVLTPWLDQRL